MNQGNTRAYAAEVLGTFTLVFLGTASVVAAGRSGAPVHLVAAFAFGLALLAGLYAFGEISGGHFNPAVSLAMFLDKRLSSADLAGYWASQLIGAVLASIVLLIATSKHDVASTANRPSSNGTGFLMELVVTTLFVLVILQASRSERFGSSALIAIPLTLLAAHLVLIPFTGCSVNPARSFGPALVGNAWTGFWVFVLAPLLGGALAWLIHAAVVTGTIGPAKAPVAEALE